MPTLATALWTGDSSLLWNNRGGRFALQGFYKAPLFVALNLIHLNRLLLINWSEVRSLPPEPISLLDNKRQ